MPPASPLFITEGVVSDGPGGGAACGHPRVEEGYPRPAPVPVRGDPGPGGSSA